MHMQQTAARRRRNVRHGAPAALMAAGLLCLALALVPAGPARAAEAADEAEPPQAAQQEREPARAETAPSPDIFVPSEEISEDFAVPFPVDI
jgi:hypothetical protein